MPFTDTAPVERSNIPRLTLAPLFEMVAQFPDASELVINAPGHVLIERSDGQWHRVDSSLINYRSVKAMALALASESKQSFSDSQPVLFATLSTGERLTFVGPPVTPPGIISLTMRLVRNSVRSMSAYDGSDFFERSRRLQAVNVSRYDKSELDQMFIELLLANKLREFLMLAVQKKLTLGIVGDTGSGKTFLMECLIQSIPVQERLLTVESARELQLTLHPNKVQLMYSHFGTGVSGLNADDLMALTKRQKPNRVLLGECIGPEAYVFLNMVISGHPGSITSWHTMSLAAARTRFVLMAREHPNSKLQPTAELEALFDLAMNVMVYVQVEHVDKGDGTFEKRRFISEVWFNPPNALP